jgi:lipid-A-disaccharide synthase
MARELFCCTKLLKEMLGRVLFLIPVAETLDPEAINGLIHKHQAEAWVNIYPKTTLELFMECDFGIVKSGTSTLEAAVSMLPIAVVYRVSSVTHLIFKHFVRYNQPIGMINLLAEKEVAREFFQKKFIASSIANYVYYYLKNPDQFESYIQELRNIRSTLKAGASRTAARLILQTIQR